MRLEAAPRKGYHFPAAEKEAAGISLLKWSGDEPQSVCHAAFLSPWCVRFWAAERGRSNAGRCSTGKANPVSVALLISLGMAVKNRNWSNIMATATPGAFAPTILPTRVNWDCISGVILEYGRIPVETLIASGLLAPDEIPENRSKSSRNGALRVHVAMGGTYNVRLKADDLLARDVSFKRFLGGLLADTRLSLVKGESHD